MFLILVLLMVFGVTAVLADDAVTSKPDLPISVRALETPAGTNIVPGLITTDFEAGDGFGPGSCEGQNGWVPSVSGHPEGHIDTANPAAGTQHLRISKDPALGTGVTTACFSPDLGALPAANTYVVEVDVAISAANGADYDVILQTPSQGFLTARVKFSFLGNIFVVDDIGAGLVFTDTGVSWNVGPYTTLRIEVDSTADTIDYYYGGALIYSSVIGVFAGTTVEQVVFLSDNWQNGDVGDFDNLRAEMTTPTAVGLVEQSVGQPSSVLPISIALLLALMTLAILSARKQQGNQI